jgi:hypothetical protein
MSRWAEPSVQLPVCGPRGPGRSHLFSQQPKALDQPTDTIVEGSTLGNMALAREDDTPPWSRGELVRVRPKTAGIWRDAYVLLQRGRNLLVVLPEVMIQPDGTRHTRLSLIAEEEPGAYHRSFDGADYEVKPSP